MQTADKVALVTGSSRGIGLGTASRLAAAGFAVILHGRTDSPALRQAEDELAQQGATVRRLAFDIADLALHGAMMQAAWEFFGRIDCMVANAGIAVRRRGDLLEMSPESFDDQIAVNLRGTFFLTQEVARRMAAQPAEGFRSIIVISSSNAVAAAVERGEYCMAKAALSMMARLFALRLAESGINVYEVRPGLIGTDMTAPVRERYDAMLEKGFSPINRWGRPDDVGLAVATLAEGRMRFTTGDALHVDGGLLIARY